MDLNLEHFKNWSPIRIYRYADQVYADWCHLGNQKFTHPFFDDTINNLLYKPFNSLFRRQTPIEFLGELYEKKRGIEPTGFIFHISRCGSTLVTQMLAAVSKNIVISEASALDKIIRAETMLPNVSEEQKIIWLKWLINAFSQPRFADEKHFFVKFDSWSVLDLQLIERAFPNVPWVFLYRNPIEVIVSNLRQTGMQLIPEKIEAIFPQMNLFEVFQLSTEERLTRTIARFCEIALENADNSNGKFINYSQLPNAVSNEICEHFKLDLTDDELLLMQNKSQKNAKSPTENFTPDDEAKRREASEIVVNLSEKFVRPVYAELEKHRLNRIKLTS